MPYLKHSYIALLNYSFWIYFFFFIEFQCRCINFRNYIFVFFLSFLVVTCFFKFAILNIQKAEIEKKLKVQYYLDAALVYKIIEHHKYYFTYVVIYLFFFE
jgi:hypothetical protein